MEDERAERRKSRKRSLFIMTQKKPNHARSLTVLKYLFVRRRRRAVHKADAYTTGVRYEIG